VLGYFNKNYVLREENNMINELHRIIVETDKVGTQVSKLPSNEDMMNKINKIIRYINKEENEKLKEKLNVKFGTRFDY
jgi:hypothetical protein